MCWRAHVCCPPPLPANPPRIGSNQVLVLLLHHQRQICHTGSPSVLPPGGTAAGCCPVRQLRSGGQCTAAVSAHAAAQAGHQAEAKSYTHCSERWQQLTALSVRLLLTGKVPAGRQQQRQQQQQYLLGSASAGAAVSQGGPQTNQLCTNLHVSVRGIDCELQPSHLRQDQHFCLADVPRRGLKGGHVAR